MMSDWIKIDRSDVVNGGLLHYLVKYTVKSGRKLFYSRGIASEFETEIDTDTDVLISYNDHGVKYILRNIQEKAQQFANVLNNFLMGDIDYSEAFVFEENRVGFCDEAGLVVTIHT